VRIRNAEKLSPLRERNKSFATLNAKTNIIQTSIMRGKRMLKIPTEQQIDLMCSAKLLSVDIESKDPELPKKGPGTHRGEGYICGTSFGIREGEHNFAYYLPLRHPDTSPEHRERNFKITKKLLESSAPKIGANFIYDLEWLLHEEFNVPLKNLHDVQYAEPLLDEYARSYKLERLARKYTQGIKKSYLLQEYCDTMGWKGDPLIHMWRIPERIAEEYAIEDALLPLEIFEKQKAALEKQGLWELYTMETELIPLLLKMRKVGVRLNMPLLMRTVNDVTDKHFALKEKLYDWAGYELNLGSSAQLARVFDKKGIAYPRREPTALMKEKGKPGNPQLDKKALNRMKVYHPICETILEFRHYDTLISMFLHPYMDFQVDGRLYGTFHPLRSDDYGTVAGRFSASKPNLQQVSAQEEDGDEDDEFKALKGQIIRALFIPEEGCKWAKLDYSQIEYRIIAHYATGRGSQELRDKYNNDPSTDMHQVIMDSTGFDRRTAKRLNFGGTYGMGIPTAADTFEWEIEESELFMNSYHAAAPYVKTTRQKVSKTASRRGYVFTVLGRKARTHPSRKLHSMFNRLIQGSAADVMKKGMVDADKKGLFDVLIPHMTVHDEMDVSYKDNKEGNEALQELKVTMEEAVTFDVPLIVDCHTGNNWAEAD
jgi:DNA polymerase I-like protein with 3'-5' exonuclease and polymerase domains